MRRLLIVISLIVVFLGLSFGSLSNIFGQESPEPGTGGSGGETIVISPGTAADIATASGFGVLASETYRLRKESKRKHRAWVGDMGSNIIFHYTYKNNQVFTAEELLVMQKNDPMKFQELGELKKIHGTIKLKNFGEIPSYHVVGREKLFIDNFPTQEDIQTIPFGFPFSIMPTGEQNYVFPIGPELNEIGKGKTGYFFYEIKYFSEESNKPKKYGFIVEISDGIYKKIKTWDENKIYSKDDIEDTKKN